MPKKFQPGCACCDPVIPPTPSPVCVSGCNGAAVPGAHVEVRNSDGDVVLSDDTGPNGCTDSILWPAGNYTATIYPPDGIPGWDATIRGFTMPGGTTLPFPLHLSTGYTCGCRAPDIHSYFGVGDPKPNLAETLFFSSELGDCTIRWYPWRAGSWWFTGIYYGHFVIEDILSSTSLARDPNGDFCNHLTPRQALVDVFFYPCGELRNSEGNPPFVVTNQCFQASSAGPFSYGGLAFGVRYLCGCVACDAEIDGLRQFNLVPDPNLVPMTDPHEPNQMASWNGLPSGFAQFMGPAFAGNLAIQQDPLLWTADHEMAWYGRGLNRCERVDWFPAGTAVVSA
jgi:hypothetical protein